MESLTINVPTGDEIVLSLTEQQTVVHETVRIAVSVGAERDRGTSEKVLRQSIKDTLRQFIDTEWRFARIERSRGTAGFEKITATAVCRAVESENVQLDERAEACSTTQVRLVGPLASYALPFDQVQKINSDLRVKLAKQAARECAAYNSANLGADLYRVGLIEFSDTLRAGGAQAAQQMRAGNSYGNNLAASAYIGVTAETPEEALDAADTGSTDLGVTERYRVYAQVTLRSNRPSV